MDVDDCVDDAREELMSDGMALLLLLMLRRSMECEGGLGSRRGIRSI